MFNPKEALTFAGYGVNHDRESFHGVFTVQPLTGKNSFTTQYQAIRSTDKSIVHTEVGLLTQAMDGEWHFHLHMEELPCVTEHRLKSNTENRWVFFYRGCDALAGFDSELVFDFINEGQFRYTHRWAMNEELSDKSWCDLSIPIKEP